MVERKSDTIDIAETREILNRLCSGFTELFEQVVEDHKKLQVCRNFTEFRAELPTTFLDRAHKRLDKKGYKVGFAGPFSGGKSTIVNALLGEPDLLPTQAGECTMSVTVVQAPSRGADEHVEVFYFSEEDALRYVLTNARYAILFARYKDELEPFDSEKAKRIIRKIIEDVRSSDEHRVKGPELAEFLSYLEKYRDRLGSRHIDKIENCAQYLTTDEKNRGLGHLLSIEQVHMFRNCRLFNEKGVGIVDLPGTDAVNDRQRELSHNYLSQADAIMLIVEPKGLAQAHKELWEELGKYNNEVRGKIFFIMNMFDRYSSDDLRKKEVERVLLAQVWNQLVNFGLDPEKLYLTSALYQDLVNRRDLGKATDKQMGDLERLRNEFSIKRSGLDANIDPRIRPLIVQCFTDGGINGVRERLVRYLERDIQIERLKEVFLDLERCYEASEQLLAPERELVDKLLTEVRSRAREVHQFFETAKEKFLDNLSVIPRGLEKVVPASLDKVKKILEAGISRVIDNFNIERLVLRMRIRNVRDIKMQVIETFKSDLSARFADFVKDNVPPLIKNKIHEQIADSRVGEILEELGKQLQQPYGERFQVMMRNFDASLDMFTYMRALEETWSIQDAPIEPRTVEPKLTEEVELAFRADLKKLFVEFFLQACSKLEAPLRRHYETLLLDLIEKFEALVTEVSAEIKKDPDAVELPVSLLAGSDEGDEEARKQRCLVNYFQIFNGIKEGRTKIAAYFR